MSFTKLMRLTHHCFVCYDSNDVVGRQFAVLCQVPQTVAGTQVPNGLKELVWERTYRDEQA